MGKTLSLLLILVLAACTKQPSSEVVVSNKPMVTPVQNPERLVFEANVLLPKEHQAKLKPTDVLLWDLKDKAGEIVAGDMQEAPKFPFQIKVAAKQLRHAIPEDSVLLFSARITRFGQENSPPVKGQLSALVGAVPSKDEVVNPNVDKKRYAEWAKKNNIKEEQVLTIGAKVTAPLAPSIW